jgi:hypothetical protein
MPDEAPVITAIRRDALLVCAPTLMTLLLEGST